MLIETTVRMCPELEGKTIKQAKIAAKAVTADPEVQLWFTDGTTCTFWLLP